MRILLVVGLIALLFAALYRVLRPAVRMVLQFIRAVHHFQQAGHSAPPAPGSGEKLIQCATCGTWVPQSRALTGNSMDFCSRECVKRAGYARRRGNSVA